MKKFEREEYKKFNIDLFIVLCAIVLLFILIIIKSNNAEAKVKQIIQPCKFGLHRVIKVSDGDTITACAEGVCLKVRVACMDAPDYDRYKFSNDARIARQAEAMGITFKETTELAGVATERAKELLLGKCVRVVPISIDYYKRLVGYIEVGGKDYQFKMIKEGLAIPYCRYNCNKFSKIEKYKKVSNFKCIND